MSQSNRPVQIEAAGLAHATLLAHLHALCFKVPWTDKAFASLLATPGTLAFLAVLAQTEEPVGFILLRRVQAEAEILSIGVTPTARSLGIGGKLLQQVAGLQGLEMLFLDVAADNESALALYRREGFKEVGRRSAYYARGSDTPVDSLTMKRELG